VRIQAVAIVRTAINLEIERNNYLPVLVLLADVAVTEYIQPLLAAPAGSIDREQQRPGQAASDEQYQLGLPQVP
jgi:hypothetical protein